MKSRNVWLYVLLGIALTLIGLGLVYTGNKKDSTGKDGNPVAEPVRKQFELMDTDNNGSISLREFAERANASVRAARAQTQKARLKRVQAQFEAGDTDQDSFINDAEYAELVLIKQLGETAPTLESADTNGDGKLGFREYVAFREKLAAGPQK